MAPLDTFDLLFSGLDIKTADIYCLVLSAKRIAFRRIGDATGWSILVKSQQLPYAKQQIEAYLKENPQHKYHSHENGGSSQQNFSMFWIAMILIAIHWAAGIGLRKQILINNFGSLSEKILKGELYRCVTALTLHSDASHLISNLAGLLLFGTFLCLSFGTGAAWMLILLGGSSGNLLNAIFHQTDHLSIGASTSVFSILGSLSAEALSRRIKIPGQKMKAFMPLGGAFALLAFLGANPETDVLAHLFGLLSGFLLASIWIRAFPERLNDDAQRILAAVSIIALLIAWQRVFYI